jgi:hypothetical protein
MLQASPYYKNRVSGASYPSGGFRIKDRNKVAHLSSFPTLSEFDDSSQQEQFSDLITAHKQVVASGLPNYLHCRIPLKSSFNLDLWRSSLVDYHDKVIVEFLQYGFPVGYEASALPISEIRNHKGATGFHQAVSSYISREIKEGVMAGPFARNPLQLPLAISPLNSVPKKFSSERRVISDLSFPPGVSVNDGIPKGMYLDQEINLAFPSVDSLATQIKLIGPSALLFKKDLRRAYRQFRIDPGDSHLLGYFWDGQLFIDLALAMGIRSAAYLCQRVTSAIKYIYYQSGFTLFNYIDDMAVCVDYNKANFAFSTLETLLVDLGVKEAPDKSCPPSHEMEFLGVLFNTKSMTMSVTPERLSEISHLIDSWLIKRKATKKQLQSLIGKLQFIAKCVRSGRIFISRLLTIIPKLHKQHHRFSINQEFRRDLLWWQKFLKVFNGTTIIPDMAWLSPHSEFATDASLKACGGWYNNQYFSCVFPVHIVDKDHHISTLELLTVMIALKLWASHFSNKRLKIHCDNEASVQVINTGRTKDRQMLSIVREIAFISAVHNIQVKGTHVKGVENTFSDLLSRAPVDDKASFKLQEFLSPSHVRIPVRDEMFDISNPW